MKKRIVSEYNKDTKISFSITINKKLVNRKSKYQKIEIYESHKFGNVLLLDGCFMFTEKDHHYYHNKCFDLINQKNNRKEILIIVSYLFWMMIKMTIGLRVSEDEESEGVDISECGLQAYPEFSKSVEPGPSVYPKK